MGECIFGEVGHRASGSFDYVVGGCKAERYVGAGEVRHSEQEVGHFSAALFEAVLEAFSSAFDSCHFFFSLFSFFFFTVFIMDSDGGGEFFKFGGVGIGLSLQAPAFAINFKNFSDDGSAVESLDTEAFDDEIGIIFYYL